MEFCNFKDLMDRGIVGRIELGSWVRSEAWDEYWQITRLSKGHIFAQAYFQTKYISREMQKGREMKKKL